MTPTIDAGLHPLATGVPPTWADGWGEDRYGVYADIAVGKVIQRLRWIPPGRFDMGSPPKEQGRYEDEGPVHSVTLALGFWLFDTPCTQALWVEVMGDNPSAFAGPNRPVESVSFENVVSFIDRLNARIPDLDLTLPSEAEWEYGCRAGTHTSTYAGDLKIRANAATALDKIAWYSDNRDKDVDLEVGEGTRAVARKAPNSWGLFDTLGNVFEWCADTWHERHEGAPTDGRAWLDSDDESSAYHVVRGGSWSSLARDVRAAYRNHFDPSGRGGGLGFRCARVQVSGEAERRAGRSRRRARSEPVATTGPERANPSHRG